VRCRDVQGTAAADILRPRTSAVTMKSMADDEAIHLMLEALFDIRAKVDEIHAVVVEEDDDEETQEDA
jgi:hypothetical protein